MDERNYRSNRQDEEKEKIKLKIAILPEMMTPRIIILTDHFSP